MIGLLTLPPLPYVIFELLRFKVDDVTRTGDIIGAAESVDVIVMDVLPTRFTYEFTGKNGINSALGDGNNTVIRGGEAPRRITLQGTFGQRYISRGGVTRNGYERLQQFKNLARKSLSVNDSFPENLPDSFRYVYGMNYYDFNERYWEAINIESFMIEKDARTHSIVPTYSVKMIGLGKIIDAIPKDPLLRNLKIAIKVQEELDKINNEILGVLENELDFIPEILADIETLQIATTAASQMAGQYNQILGMPLTNGLQSILSPLAQVGSSLGNIASFGDLLDL